MIAYIIRRIGGSIVVLIGISIITFSLAYLVPANPARAIVGPHASEALVLQVEKQLGLNEPLPVRYVHYMGNLLQGNLGTSYVLDQPVTTLISQRAGATAQLAVTAWIAELLIGIPIGIISALYDRKAVDHVVSILALVGISLPVFFVGLELMYWVGFKLGWLPVGGTGGFNFVILPALTYAITGAAYYARLLKSSMIDVMSSDYIRTARAKGASPNRVIFGHALRNAIIPVMTYGGIDIASLFGGVVVIEDVFGYSGIGQLTVQAINNLDVPVIMGTVLFAALFVVLFNLLVDVLYGIVDPRITY
ncbi:MAG: ABC transporter permease [Acidibacillus sp.]|uniref:Glutathione transport system permease protein GsiC n=1 Tax=Sulfoacidibacillus ferrooxidans TaxID=2005001 RepID=A0A9X1V7L3_9BACL|nr:Glutathione transport system permease protein GsiC [Sulfoacidibacillus ferrooxidans]MCY0892533.1 ABC transporter permease [Acidibacillus sp.]